MFKEDESHACYIGRGGKATYRQCRGSSYRKVEREKGKEERSKVQGLIVGCMGKR